MLLGVGRDCLHRNLRRVADFPNDLSESLKTTQNWMPSLPLGAKILQDKNPYLYLVSGWLEYLLSFLSMKGHFLPLQLWFVFFAVREIYYWTKWVWRSTLVPNFCFVVRVMEYSCLLYWLHRTRLGSHNKLSEKVLGTVYYKDAANISSFWFSRMCELSSVNYG